MALVLRSPIRTFWNYSSFNHIELVQCQVTTPSAFILSASEFSSSSHERYLPLPYLLPALSGIRSALLFYPGSAKPQRLLCSLTDPQNALIEHLGLDLKQS